MMNERKGPQPEDWRFLAELKAPWSGVLSELLRREGVPFMTRDRMGAGLALKAGPLLERTSFYVPYTYYEHAADLLKNVSQD